MERLLMGQHDPWQNREWNGFCGTELKLLTTDERVLVTEMKN